MQQANSEEPIFVWKEGRREIPYFSDSALVVEARLTMKQYGYEAGREVFIQGHSPTETVHAEALYEAVREFNNFPRE